MPDTINLQQSTSFFDPANPNNKVALLPIQVNPSAPAVSGLDSVTSPVLPTTPTRTRLDHFPEESYDLTSTSHLIRFLHALMGDAGAGQLRKRYVVAQFQNALSSTQFYDLDRFYGALFHAQRNPTEQLPISPMVDAATPDEWDQYSTGDAKYRERINAMAKAISMGATVPGVQSLAEAVLLTPVDVYETRAMLDATGQPGAARTWSEVEATFPSYASAESGTWSEVAGTLSEGRTGGMNRSEFVIRPKRAYTGTQPGLPCGTPPADPAVQQAQDTWSILSVVSTLKPAGSLLSVDSDANTVHRTVPISNVMSPSRFWEVVRIVSPRSTTKSAAKVYPLSAGQKAAGVVVTDPHILPQPVHTRYQGDEWSYNTEVTSISAYSESAPGVVASPVNYEIVDRPNGQVVLYTAEKGMLGLRQANAGRYAIDGVTASALYSSERVAVVDHG